MASLPFNPLNFTYGKDIESLSEGEKTPFPRSFRLKTLFKQLPYSRGSIFLAHENCRCLIYTTTCILSNAILLLQNF